MRVSSRSQMGFRHCRHRGSNSAKSKSTLLLGDRASREACVSIQGLRKPKVLKRKRRRGPRSELSFRSTCTVAMSHDFTHESDLITSNAKCIKQTRSAVRLETSPLVKTIISHAAQGPATSLKLHAGAITPPCWRIWSWNLKLLYLRTVLDRVYPMSEDVGAAAVFQC